MRAGCSTWSNASACRARRCAATPPPARRLGTGAGADSAAGVAGAVPVGADLTGRRDLGLEFGRQVRPDTFDVLGYALMTCRNLGEAIGLVPLYRRVVFDPGYSETRFSREGANVKLAWVILPEATQAGLPYSELLAESLIASWYGLGRWITGAEMPLREVRFRHAAPEDPLPFANFFGCPVRFAAGENALLFAADLLAQPLVQADAELNLAMCDEARKAIARRSGETPIAAQVRQMLAPLLPKCEATLNTSPRAWASRRAPCNAVWPAPTFRSRRCSTTRAANWRRCICATPRFRRWMSRCCWAMPNRVPSPAPFATGSAPRPRPGAHATPRRPAELHRPRPGENAMRHLIVLALLLCPALAAAQKLESIRLPPGFSIELWAKVDNARQMALGGTTEKGGVLYVGSRGAGKVHAVRFDAAYRAGAVTRIADGLDMPSGLAWKNGALYVGAVNRILRYDDIDRIDARRPPAPVVVTDSLPRETHHGWKFIAFGPDGKLYVPVGAPCNICEPGEPYAACCA
jgi:hypothetical protein